MGMTSSATGYRWVWGAVAVMAVGVFPSLGRTQEARIVLAAGEPRQQVMAVAQTLHRLMSRGDFLAAYDMFSRDIRDQHMTLIEFMEVWTALQKEIGAPMTCGPDDRIAAAGRRRLEPDRCPDPFTDYDAVTAYYHCRGGREGQFEIGVRQTGGAWAIVLWRFRLPGKDWKGFEAEPHRTGGRCP